MAGKGDNAVMIAGPPPPMSKSIVESRPLLTSSIASRSEPDPVSVCVGPSTSTASSAFPARETPAGTAPPSSVSSARTATGSSSVACVSRDHSHRTRFMSWTWLAFSAKKMIRPGCMAQSSTGGHLAEPTGNCFVPIQDFVVDENAERSEDETLSGGTCTFLGVVRSGKRTTPLSQGSIGTRM